VTERSVQQKKQDDEPRWLVKNEQEEVFGPVGFETLKAWARDGRLSPTSMVSQDVKAWSPVAHVPGLEMDWVAEVSPGVFYGPIHYQAMRELQGDGSIAPTAVLFTRDGGASVPRHAAEDTRATSAGTALAEDVRQAEHARTLLAAQVAQLTAQLAERDARLRHFEQQAADASMLQRLAQEIIFAQELGTRQVLDAVAHAQAAVARQTETLQEVSSRQVANRKSILDAVASAQEKVSADITCDITRELTQGRQTLLEAFSDAQETISARVVHDVSAKLPPEKPEHAAEAHAQAAAACVRQAVRDAAASLARDVETGQGQILSAVGDTVTPLTRQVRRLSEEVQALGKTLAEAQERKAPAYSPEPTVERVYVEAEVVDAETVPPRPSAPHEARAKPKASAHKPPPPPNMGGTGGFSMAELEQQARRELERLGAQGVNLFKRTK